MPALVELDMLPDIGLPTAEPGTSEAGAVRRCLLAHTAESQPPSHQENTDTTMVTATSANQQQDQLIVSTDEHSANDEVIMDPALEPPKMQSGRLWRMRMQSSDKH